MFPRGHGRVPSAQRSSALCFVLPVRAHSVGSAQSRSLAVRDVPCYGGWEVQLCRLLPTSQLAHSRRCRK